MWTILSSLWPYILFALIAPLAVVLARFAFNLVTRGNINSITISGRGDIADLVKGFSERSEFLGMAYDGAASDKKFVDLLVRTLLRGFEVHHIPAFLEIVDADIDATIEHARRMFEGLTGAACAVSIQIVDVSEDHRDYVFPTLVRDHSSRITRTPLENASYRGNTGYREILTPVEGMFRNDTYVNDNLGRSFSQGLYIDERPDWQTNYNAVLVCGIPSLISSQPWAGFLSIDNKVGGFDNPVARGMGKEIAWRLAGMLYKLHRLGELVGKPQGSAA